MSTTTSTTKTVEAIDLDPAQIVPHPMNPRESAEPDEGLVDSVRQMGVLERLVLAPVPADLPASARCLLVPEAEFLLIAGHRRLMAALEAELDSVPVDVRHDLDTTEAQLAAIAAENVHRKDLSALEEGDLYLSLGGLGLSQAQITGRTGVAKGRVSERSRVAKLPDLARDRFARGQVTLEAALQLAKLADDQAAVEQIAVKPVYMWEQEVNRVLRVKERERQDATTRKALTGRGVTVVSETLDDAVSLEMLLSDYCAPGEPVWRAVMESLGQPVEEGEKPEDLPDVEWEDVEAWHEKTCAGHVVVETHHKGNDYTPSWTEWNVYCANPAAHDDLLPDPDEHDALGAGPGTAHGSRIAAHVEDPEVAARRAHLETRVEQHTAWAVQLLKDGATVVADLAWSEARARVGPLELTPDGQIAQPWRESVLRMRAAVLALPDETAPAVIEEQFAALADSLDLPGLLALYHLAEHGPPYGDVQMSEPGGFDRGWVKDRVKLLHELGWAWDEQELDEIRQHPKLAESLGLGGDQ